MARTIELQPLKGQPSVIHQCSRFNHHPLFVDPQTGRRFLGTWRPPNITPSSSDLVFTISADVAFRPDLVSYKFYDTPLLAWVLSYVNGVANPWDRKDGFYTGRVLRIPDPASIFSELL